MKNSAGYTLIELMVGLIVISVVFGIGVSGYRDFARRQALTGAGKIVVSDLRLAQQKASSGEKPSSGTCSSENLKGYYFRATSSTSYTISATCASGENIIKTVNILSNPLTSDITISLTTPILFKVLGQGTNLSSGSTLTVTDTKTGRQNIVSISQGGSIE